MFFGPRLNLVEINKQIIALYPRRELGESLVVVVARNAGVEHVVPAMESANQVVSADFAVSHQRTAVQATPVQHRVVVIEANDN